MLCEYKHSLGVPDMVFAWRDTVAIIGGFIIALAFKFNVLYTIISLFIIRILAHRLFCVRTTVDKILFP